MTFGSYVTGQVNWSVRFLPIFCAIKPVHAFPYLFCIRLADSYATARPSTPGPLGYLSGQSHPNVERLQCSLYNVQCTYYVAIYKNYGFAKRRILAGDQT